MIFAMMMRTIGLSEKRKGAYMNIGVRMVGMAVLMVCCIVRADVYDEYPWMFEKMPKKYHKILAQQLQRLENIQESAQKEKSQSLQEVDPLDRNLLALLEEYKKAKIDDPELMRDKNFKLRNELGKVLVLIMAAIEDVATYATDLTVYVYHPGITRNKQKRMRHEVCPDKENPHCQGYMYTYNPQELVESKKIRSNLVNLYKIHLMPQEGEILLVLQKLLEAFKTDVEFASLLNDMKIYTYLREVQDDGLMLSSIVLYPISGKANVQKLLDKVMLLFKGVHGTGHFPRYNTSVNDLIFYAQGGGDDKVALTKSNAPWARLGNFFDKSTNYALYRPDFEKIVFVKDFYRSYIPPEYATPLDNPYALKF